MEDVKSPVQYEMVEMRNLAILFSSGQLETLTLQPEDELDALDPEELHLEKVTANGSKIEVTIYKREVAMLSLETYQLKRARKSPLKV